MVQDKLLCKGKWNIEHYNKEGELLGIYEIPNGITDVGMNYLLNTGFDGGTAVTTWYIGLIDNSGFSALANADTMASHAGWTENVAYSESTRPQWTCGSASSRAITNGSTVDFSINADSQSLNGLFITSNNTKVGTTGTLWSTASFGSAVPLNNGDVLKTTYSLSG
jgi:hypothetical protein